jgi:hypothetical protein
LTCRFAIAALVLVAWTASTAAAPASDRCSDEANVGGVRVRGFLLHASPLSGGTFVARLDWLRKNAAPLHRRVTQAEDKSLTADVKTLLDRIETWKADRTGSPGLSAHLAAEAERIRGKYAKPLAGEPFEESDRAEFTILDLDRKAVASLRTQPESRRRLLLLAWEHRIANAEDKTEKSLTAALRDAGAAIADDADLPDLSDRLPFRLDTERQWRVRRAIVESAFLPLLELQGTGSLAFPLNDAAADPLSLALQVDPEAIQSTINDLLGEITGGKPNRAGQAHDPFWSTVQKKATEASATAVRGVKLHLNPTELQTRIESRFLVADDQPGQWIAAWNTSESSSGPVDPAEIQRLKADPRIRQAIDAVRNTGVVDAAAIETALNVGAATKRSLDRVNSRWGTFREPFLRRLDGPPLFLPDAMPGVATGNAGPQPGLQPGPKPRGGSTNKPTNKPAKSP